MRFIILAKPTETGKELTAQADSLTELADHVWNEAVKSGISKDDESLSDVFSLLQASKEEINNARKGIEDRQYNISQEHIAEAKWYIEESVIKLASIKAQKTTEKTNTVFVPIQTPQRMSPTWIAAVIIAILALTLLGYDLHARKHRGKRLEELYDLRTTKDQIFGHTRGGIHKTSRTGPAGGKDTLSAIRKE